MSSPSTAQDPPAVNAAGSTAPAAATTAEPRADGPSPSPGASPATRARDRLFALDVLRGVAIIIVVFWHWPGFRRGMGPFGVISEVGWVGVDLFFVLSGFLISGLLFKEWDRRGSIDVVRFWLRRGFKIWPAYFAAFGFAMTLRSVPIVRRQGAGAVLAELRRFVPSMLFVQNYFPEYNRWRYTWSLAVEEHFYLALPLALLALAALDRSRAPGAAGRPVAPGDARSGAGAAPLATEMPAVRPPGATPFRLLPWFTLLVCLAVLALRVVAVRRGAPWVDVYFRSHLRADSLLFGVLVGHFCRYHPEAHARLCRRWPLVLAAVLVALAATARYPLVRSPVTYTVGFTVLYLSFGGLVAVAAGFPAAGRGLALARLVAAAGRYSYTIYLAHGAIQTLPYYGRTESFAARFAGIWGRRAAFVGLAVAGGLLLSWVVERPALRWRDRRLPARDRARPNAQGAESPPGQGAAAPADREPAPLEAVEK